MSIPPVLRYMLVALLASHFAGEAVAKTPASRPTPSRTPIKLGVTDIPTPQGGTYKKPPRQTNKLSKISRGYVHPYLRRPDVSRFLRGKIYKQLKHRIYRAIKRLRKKNKSFPRKTKILIHVTLLPSGKATKVKAMSPQLDKRTLSHINKLVKRWRFPTHRKKSISPVISLIMYTST